MTKSTYAIFSAAALAATVTAANAQTFIATDGFGRAAQVDFAIDGSTLVVTLSNISTSDVLVPIDILTGVYWNMSNASTLSKDSAILNTGSVVIYDTQPAGGVVGGEWCFKDSLSHHGSAYGISSSGLGLFGDPDLFPGTNLAGPGGPDGLQYGITSAGDVAGTGNAGVTGSGGLIQNSVVFRLGGLSEGFSLDSISNVGFQYGTDVSEPFIETPAPGSLAALGMVGAASLRRRRR